MKKINEFQEELTKFKENLTSDLTQSLEQWQGFNAIQYAALQGYTRFLADTPITLEDLESTSPAGMTALHLAAVKGHLGALKVLLEKGCSIHHLTNKKYSVLHEAVILPALYENYTVENKLKIVNLLIEKDESLIPLINDSGENVAHIIAGNGLTDALPILGNIAPNILRIANNFNKYPIHIAVLNNQLKTAKYLMSQPKPFELIDSNGQNALHYAAKHGNEEMIKACFDKDYLESPDYEGKTPIICAAENGNEKGVNVLLTLGADPLAKSRQGFTMIDYAEQNRHVNLVNWLLEHTSLKVNPLIQNKQTLG